MTTSCAMLPVASSRASITRTIPATASVRCLPFPHPFRSLEPPTRAAPPTCLPFIPPVRSLGTHSIRDETES